MFNKTEQLLAYLAKKKEGASITVLMKLAYLLDLVNMKKHGRQISEFTYRRFYFGPFDQAIYAMIKNLTESNILIANSDFTQGGEEYVTYSFNEDADFDFSSLSNEEISLADSTLESIKGYGAKALTEIAYKTKPMVALGATLGGNEHLNETLDLSAS